MVAWLTSAGSALGTRTDGTPFSFRPLLMRDPPPLLADHSCAIRLRSSLGHD
jgi:hypothetical protein